MIKCEYCYKSYSCRKSYKRHLKEIHFHNILRCACNICSKTFSRKCHLRKHIRNLHRSTCERDNITVTIDNENYSTENYPYVNTEELPSTSFSENFVCPDIFEDVGDDFENFIYSVEFNSPNLGNSQNYSKFINAEQMNDTTDENNNNHYVIDSEKQTIILKLETTTVNFSDGNSFTNRDATIEYSKNVDKEDINVSNIVHLLEYDINNYLNEKQSAKCYEI